MFDIEEQIAQLKQKGYSEEQIARVVEINKQAHEVANRLIECLNGHAPPIMGAALSIACTSFFEAAEANSGTGEKTKQTMIHSFGIMTIDDVPTVN